MRAEELRRKREQREAEEQQRARFKRKLTELDTEFNARFTESPIDWAWSGESGEWQPKAAKRLKGFAHWVDECGLARQLDDLGPRIASGEDSDLALVFEIVLEAREGKTELELTRKLPRDPGGVYRAFLDLYARLREEVATKLMGTRSRAAESAVATAGQQQQTERPAEETGAKSSGEKKRSTARGEARPKIISALAHHHQYENGSCGNFVPIGVNELARQADVAPDSVNRFFNKQFDNGRKRGFVNYQIACRDRGQLVHSLKLLLGEVTPSILFKSVSDASELEDTED